MCVSSMIYDHYDDKWGKWVTPYQDHNSLVHPKIPNINDTVNVPCPDYQSVVPSPLTIEEIEEFRTLLARAKDYDKRNNEPECEMESKKESLRNIAKQLGVEIDFIDK